MGKSASCLRILSCGGGSVESNEAGPVDQTKRPKEKKRWSFKKSSTSQAVTISVIAKNPSLEHKENLQSAAEESIVSEKDSAPQWEEKSPPPPQVAADLSVPDAVKISKTEKQPTTAGEDSYVADAVSIPQIEKQPTAAAADSYVADDLSVPQTEKQLTTTAADSYVADGVSVLETEKQPTTARADVYAADDVSVPKTEKQSDPEDSFITDGSTDPKIRESEAVLAVHESAVIATQSAVQGLSAPKELENIIKLQAMVRGHLVRCNAVGALRCVHAIAKMQVLVRARYARTRKDSASTKSKPEITYTSMSDLLKNSFARLLLESSPKSKPIKIKCDPLSQDSSWVWLERWMSLATPCAVADRNAANQIVQEVKVIDNEREGKPIDKEQEEKIIVEDHLFNEENELFLDAKDFANPSLSRKYSQLDVTEETKLTSNSGLSLTNSDVDTHSLYLAETQEQDPTEEAETVELGAKQDAVSRTLNHTVSIYYETEIDFLEEKSESNTEQAVELRSELGEELKTKVEADKVEQLRKENEINVSGSEEEPDSLLVTEPELILAPLSANLSESVSHDAGVEEPISATHLAVVYHDSMPFKGEVKERPASVPNSGIDYISASQNEEEKEVKPHSSHFELNEETAASSEDDIVINHKEASQSELLSNQVGESECGTELSITSTLDSPDRSEIEHLKVELEKGVSTDAVYHEESETNTGVDLPETASGTVGKGKSDIIGDSEHATGNDIGLDEKELDTKEATQQLLTEASEERETTDASDFNAEPEADTERSHQASPGSEVSFSWSQGTPSSQASFSTKSKVVKSGKSGSIKKRAILSAAKKSPSLDSGEKNTLEQQFKEQKSAKRRTSFSSPKPEVSDQELRRDSSTSSSLPSYMQATESAKAKANAAGQSPRSSPDVADKDVFLRKRHSLSSTRDKQDSPRLQRTSSQAQSGTKSNGTSPIERKWQR